MRKRKLRRGQGNVRELPDGRFQARIQLMGRRVTAVRRTEAEAWTALTRLQRQLEDNEPRIDHRTTVRAYLTEWLANIEGDIEPTTHRLYAGHIANHVIPAIGAMRLVRLEPEHIDRMLREARSVRARKANTPAKTLSPTTRSQIRTILRIALGEAYRRGRLQRNAAALSRVPEMKPKKHRVLTVAQSRALIAAAKDDPWGAMYTLTLDTGLRQGEILGLRWQDLDLDNHLLRVAQSVQRVRGTSIVKDPKSETSSRDIAFTPLSADLLTQHRTRQKAARMAARKWQDLDLVFAGESGQPLIGSTVAHRWKRFRDAASLPPITFHELRHSSATLLIKGGVPMKEVSERLGHSSIVITSDIYTHLDRDIQERVAKRMGDILGGAETG